MQRRKILRQDKYNCLAYKNNGLKLQIDTMGGEDSDMQKGVLHFAENLYELPRVYDKLHIHH